MVRQRLSSLYILSSLTLLFRLTSSSPTCKSDPSSPTWPSPLLWSQLNETLGGQLIAPTPPGAVCHPTHPEYNAALCPYVQYYWSNEFFHQTNPVSVEWNNWNNDTCLPIDGYPCSSQGYPVFVVNATTKEHVKAGVDFGEFSHLLPGVEGVWKDLLIDCW